MISQLSTYVADALDRPLPDDVAVKTADHVLDTLAAIVSGSRMAAGEAGLRYARRYGGGAEALVVGTDLLVAAPQAALANGMSAHADETDDSHEPSRTHPGCAIVPAALAMAERDGASGARLLRAVALGYDMCARFTPSLWPDFDVLRAQRIATHAIGPTFSSAVTAGALARLDATRVRYLLAYTAQQLSGIMTWKRDVEHIEKAFVFAGMPAFKGVQTVTLVEQGWPGVRDVFSGDPNLHDVLGVDADPSLLVDGLGERFEIMNTNIKRFPVGSPIQAPLQGLLGLMADEGLRDEDVAEVSVALPTSLYDVVAERQMGDINIRFLVTAALEDGDVTFASSHDTDRFGRWRSAGGDPRVTIVPDHTMTPTRQAVVEVTTRDGRTVRRHESAVRGTAQNPMTTDEVDAKARDLLAPVLGTERTERLVATVRDLPALDDCRDLRELYRQRPRTSRTRASSRRTAGPDDLARTLATYAADASGDLAPEVVREATRRVVDTVAVALAGMHGPGPRAARTYAYETPVAHGSRIWGTPFRTTAEAATLANGAALRFLDHNDAYFGLEANHPSDMIGGLVAVGERYGRNGRDLLTAIAVGYEVTVSLCDAVSLRRRGWDHVNLTAIGACCGVGRLMGLDAEQLAQALAVTVVPHAAMRQTRHGHLTMWKGLAAADAVRHAVYACSLARAGVEGARDPFEGGEAWLQQLADGALDEPSALDRIRRGAAPRRLLDTHLKAWPLGYVAQSGVQAALVLHERLGGDARGVESLHIDTFQAARDIMAEPEKWRPTTRETADHSLPYAVAAALTDGRVDVATFEPERFTDPDMQAFLADRVTLRVDEELQSRYPGAFPTRLTVRTAEGEEFVELVEHPAGHARNPLSDTGLEEKFRSLSEPVLGETASDVHDLAMSLADITVDELTAALVV